MIQATYFDSYLVPLKTYQPAASTMSPRESSPSRTNSRVTIRPIQSEDLLEVIAIFIEGFLSYPEHKSPEMIDHILRDVINYAIRSDLSDIEGTYQKNGGNFWVATLEEDNKKKSTIVGMIGLEAKPGCEGEIRRMFVKSGYRGYGIGRLLIACLEDWAKSHGIVRVWLATGEVMKQAQYFYESCGYTHTKFGVYPMEPFYRTTYYAKEL